ncbi:hypothetical protein CONPUDRAFT_169653 [Coniophora puteana RWD-64-598 SS2]|uniref:F-box domain-containing protein n=1 Tax=Coniophora puteana (strain RWD-64-598) TaxID=741705 RepID=A0A5M3M8L6_CONPW|nr:uncharacterized protein CONPUDRAFT_169653 [Coniophora puteana RWD-64-598 SS2]EIW75276.1 hypothetical protein CONPUDRAFT_169653 [Coniophora puteana RWD-64-598 SS2]
MGQYWMFLNIDRREEKSYGKLGEFFSDGRTGRNIAARLCQLRPLPKIPRIQSDDAGITDTESVERGLLSLPDEIICHIINDIESLEDFVCFAATCHRCWDICIPFLEKCIRSLSWAGCRIIGLGDYVGHDDLPPDILTEDEQAELATAKPGKYGPVSLYSYARTYYGEAVLCSRLEDFTDGLLSDLIQRGLVGAPFVAIKTMCTPFEPTVLRNLSKKLYVRADTIDALNEELPQREWFWDHKAYSLGDALVSRICWSSDPSCSMRAHCKDITRGPWAGDAFDITSMEEFQKQEDFSQWVDAKKDVCRALRECWDDG